MERKVRLSSNIVKLFDDGGDLMVMLAKVKLVAMLQKILDRASFIPLFLERGVLANSIKWRGYG